MAKHIQLEGIVLTSGGSVEVASGVTAIVGPNNTGKSSLLRELFEHLRTEPDRWTARSRKVVDSPTVAFTGTAEDQIAEIATLHKYYPPGIYTFGRFIEDTVHLPNGIVMPISSIVRAWGSDTGLGSFGNYFVTHLNAEGRLGLTASAEGFDTLRQLPGNPLQLLYVHRELEGRIADLSERAFKSRVTVNRYAGSVIHLHSGHVEAAEGPSPQTEEYLTELNALEFVQEQGDGMRAFIGMLMAILVGHTPLVLIDEPEAFLHPPQARIFGQFLAEYASTDSDVQVIVATHSEDIVAGLTSVSNAAGRVSIARMTRLGNSNNIAQLSAEAVARLYADPLMKHYDMLNGLFTTGVVLCEADSDCTYYRAALDAVDSSGLNYAKEAHFTHTGGKARIAKAVEAFGAAAVPTAAIFDIDILQDEKEFEALVNAVGADKTVLDRLRHTVVSAVQSRSTSPTRTAAKAEVDEIFARSSSEKLAASDVRAIRDVVAIRSGWKQLKLAGKSMLSGDALTAFNELCLLLEEKGVFIIEQGELERFHPEVTQSNKAAWLRTVVDRGLYVESPARDLLTRVSKFLEASQAIAARPSPHSPPLAPSEAQTIPYDV